MSEDDDHDYWQEGDVDGNRAPAAEETLASAADAIEDGSRVKSGINSEAISDAMNKHRNEARNEDKDGAQMPAETSAHPYSRLRPETIIEAVESTGRVSDARILGLNSYENRVYQVGIEADEPVVVKFYRPQRWTPQQIQEEHDYCQFLTAREIPVVAPLRDDEGRSLFEYDGFQFSVYPRQGGRAPELDNIDHLEQLGQFIGRLHAAGEAFQFNARIDLSVDRMGAKSVDYLIDNHVVPDDLREAYQVLAQQILEQLNAIDLQRFKTLSLHGDCHPGNVLWREDRPHFVDFDDAISGPAIQDLWMLLSGDRHQRLTQLAAIIEGYERFMPFNDAELMLVEPLRALRVLHYNAWLARRWTDPAFPMNFPWFNTLRYWSEHILELKELMSTLQEPPLTVAR